MRNQVRKMELSLGMGYIFKQTHLLSYRVPSTPAACGRHPLQQERVGLPDCERSIDFGDCHTSLRTGSQ